MRKSASSVAERCSGTAFQDCRAGKRMETLIESCAIILGLFKQQWVFLFRQSILKKIVSKSHNRIHPKKKKYLQLE